MSDNTRANQPLWKLGFFSNKNLVWAFLFSSLLQLSVVYIPYLANIFKIVPPTWQEWKIILLCSVSILVVMEIIKTLQIFGGKGK